MWEAIYATERSDKITKVKVTKDQSPLSFSKVISLWKNDKVFRTYYNGLLAQSTYEAFYWEVPPMVINRLEDPFEFVLIESEPLKRITANSRPFQEYFRADEKVVCFWNLGKDAKLVVPCPLTDEGHYAHLANFVRSKQEEQIDAFWQTIGTAYEQLLGSQVKWLSTAGLGVSWLHLRIDSRPKYYRYTPYKSYDS